MMRIFCGPEAAVSARRIGARRVLALCGAVFLAAILATAAPSTANAACGFDRPKISYMAKNTSTQGAASASATVYYADGMERHEPAGMTEVLIYRYDKNVEWMLLPEFKRFSERVIEDDPEQFMKFERGGKETVGGVETTLCKFKAVYPDGGTEVGTMWISNDGVVLKRAGTLADQQGEIEYKQELTEFRLVEHDKMLFAVPSDYDPQPIAIQGLGMN